MKPNDWLFPFHTCEIPSGKENLIQQPFSAIINLTTSIILIYYLIIAKSLKIKFLIFLFILFELFHSYSHIRHINGNIQRNIIHFIWYILSLTILFIFIEMNNKIPLFIYVFLFILILIDLYLVFNNYGFFSIVSGVVFLVFIFILNYPYLSKNLQIKLNYLFIGTIILIFFLFNEKYNCEYLMKFYKFPYHIFLEITGLILFVLLTDFFITLENTKT